MTQEQTHYDVLGVAEDASSSDIKRAFYVKVREHPPEQDPEAYKALREAYDVLYNPVSRKEYDNMASYGAEIEALQKEAEALLSQEEPDVEGAIRTLKRAVVLGPDIGLLRNLLGTAYLMHEAARDALKQFDKAIELDEHNPAYRLNRGHAQRVLGDLSGAKRTFRAVWNDDQGDYAAARALAGVLFQQEAYDEVDDVLDTAIWADGKLDFEDFFCYFDKLEYLVLRGETDTLEDELETVLSLPETEDDRRFASFMLGRTGAQLYEANAFSLAERFTDAAETLNPDDANLALLAEQARTLRGIEDDVDAALEDSRVHDFVQHMIAIGYERAIGRLSDAEARMEEIVQVLDNVMQADPDHTKIKKSLRRVQRKYSKAYNISEGLFDAVLELPATDMFAAPCPHCEETIVAHKRRNRGQGACPHCERPIDFTGSRFRRQPASYGGSENTVTSSSSSSNASGSDGEGCFVATAVYADYDHPDVLRLRAFRDERLSSHAPGRAFIRLYYRYGPGWARQLKRYPRACDWVRSALASFVRLFC